VKIIQNTDTHIVPLTQNLHGLKPRDIIELFCW